MESTVVHSKNLSNIVILTNAKVCRLSINIPVMGRERDRGCHLYFTFLLLWVLFRHYLEAICLELSEVSRIFILNLA